MDFQTKWDNRAVTRQRLYSCVVCGERYLTDRLLYEDDEPVCEECKACNDSTPKGEAKEKTMYQFAILDPRSTEQAVAHNASILAGGYVLGIEVTVPSLAEMCLGNLDHHGGSVEDQCAIEIAMFWTPLPHDGATLATVRPDPDSIGAMAILELRRRVVEQLQKRLENRSLHERFLMALVSNDPTGPDGSAIRERVKKIAQADKALRGPWPGPQPLSACWPVLPPGSVILSALNGDEAPEMAALGAMCQDHQVTLEDRVAMMISWLTQGTVPDTYISRAAAERRELVEAIEAGKIRATTIGDVAVVHSTHRAATEVGYRLAPVVLAVNGAFRFQGGEPHLKYTLCQYREGYVDLRAVLAELQAREAGWGGTGTIIGSPQGISSILSVEEILETVEYYYRVFLEEEAELDLQAWIEGEEKEEDA